MLELVLDQIPPIVQAGSVRLLLLGALLLRSRGRVGDAFRRTMAAQRVAECQGDVVLIRDCMLVETRLRWDTGEYAPIVPRLLQAYAEAVAAADFDNMTLLLGLSRFGARAIRRCATGPRICARVLPRVRAPHSETCHATPVSSGRSVCPSVHMWGCRFGGWSHEEDDWE